MPKFYRLIDNEKNREFFEDKWIGKWVASKPTDPDGLATFEEKEFPARFSAKTYALVASVIRKRLEPLENIYVQYEDKLHKQQGARNELYDTAIEFAAEFAKDNPMFDVARFLDACSPDPERFPISELWEGDKGD